MINRIYGILSDGVIRPGDGVGRFSDSSAGPVTSKALAELLSTEPEERSIQIEFLLWLLRSHRVWIKLVREFDPINTYDTIIPIDRDHGITLARLHEWVRGLPQINNEYTLGATEDDLPIDLIVDRIVGLLTSNN